MKMERERERERDRGLWMGTAVHSQDAEAGLRQRVLLRLSPERTKRLQLQIHRASFRMRPVCYMPGPNRVHRVPPLKHL